MIKTLAEKAMLVRLTRSMFQPYAFDRQTTQDVELQTGVRKAGRFNKRLMLDCGQLKDTISAYNAVYGFHMLHTVPWLDDGMRMLPADQYFDYNQGIRELIHQAERTADELAARWDEYVQADMARLGPLADIRDYPTDIRNRFAVSIKFLPVPSSSDFRVQISDEDRASLDQALVEAEQRATVHLLEDMLEPVRRAVEKLSTPIGQEGSIFRDSLISNMIEAAQRARKLNVAGDARITAMVDEIIRTATPIALSAHQVREDNKVREDKAAQLASLMGKFSGMF